MVREQQSKAASMSVWRVKEQTKCKSRWASEYDKPLIIIDRSSVTTSKQSINQFNPIQFNSNPSSLEQAS